MTTYKMKKPQEFFIMNGVKHYYKYIEMEEIKNEEVTK